jgi:hypothetical protein
MKPSILHQIRHNCEAVSQLALREVEMPLSLSEKAFMSAHLLFCKCCQNFVKENTAIDKALHTYFDTLKNQPPLTLSDDFKQKLQDKIME